MQPFSGVYDLHLQGSYRTEPPATSEAVEGIKRFPSALTLHEAHSGCSYGFLRVCRRRKYGLVNDSALTSYLLSTGTKYL